LTTKARVLFNLARWNDAVSLITAAQVPTTYQLNATFSLTSGSNQIWSLNTSAKRWTVGDSVDKIGRIINAIPFASANDPRVPVTGTTLGTSPAGPGFDTQTNFVFQRIWGRTDATPIVSGLDARLMEAEIRLRADDYAGMMTILNALRATPPALSNTYTPAAMTALATPASKDAAIDLYFREKAFWTFGRGQRLPDMRRLIRQYGRPQTAVFPQAVFPQGTFFKTNTPYGTDVNFPVTTDELNNPEFAGCTDRNA
jgi:starch-binding outer membrane protein, SusD/RagB family